MQQVSILSSMWMLKAGKMVKYKDVCTLPFPLVLFSTNPQLYRQRLTVRTQTQHKSTANIFMPDTKLHLQRSCGVHVLMGQSCFGSKRET